MKRSDHSAYGRRAASLSLPTACVLILVLLLAGCGASTSSSSSPATFTSTSSTGSTAIPTTASTAPQSSTTLVTYQAISEQEAQALRDLAFAYWAAFDAYDVQGTLAYLEPSYRAARAKVVQGDIGRIKLFGVKLGLSEKTPPVLVGPGQAQMYMNLKEPTGTRTILMKFAQTGSGDPWLITFAEEVP
jgi:hypothetical protein